MAEQLDTLVTPEMLAAKDQWTPPYASPPVSANDIRKWAIAVYWPETPPRIFWDEDYARGTKFGGIIAPQDFNPFAWPISPPPMVGGGFPPERMGTGPGTNMMNGGQVDHYYEPIRPGDVITQSSALVGWNERQGRLGLTIFANNETRWTNQHGVLVKRRISTSIRY
jgi:hypothetical protein